MKLTRAFLTSLFIAISAYSVSATAENVYKCGNSYSSTPCANGQTLDVSDERTTAQQAQTRRAASQDAVQARQLEKMRLANEKIAAKQVNSPAKTPVAAQLPTPQPQMTVITPKRLKKPGKKPEAFIAEIPGSEKKKVSKKTRKTAVTTTF
ncbi:hypothetical protein [Rhodoferax sp.]|uniref:hypothetical protein n=2 Tax=Rhodoferax sp. TaxID=50421 RepID=UPI002616CDB5|nr:hypothetical protein [Rhodoferax sp.]MDD5479219.1 hypothetical protein [Rhodoferax sp.]